MISLKKIFMLSVLSLGIVLSALYFYFVPSQTNAQGLIPFGGRVISSVYCTGSHRFLLTISPPLGGFLVYDPATPQIYESFNLGIQTGMWAVGLYNPITDGCWMVAAPHHILIPSQGMITPTVGTSPLF